jgi:hypothetical protein
MHAGRTGGEDRAVLPGYFETAIRRERQPPVAAGRTRSQNEGYFFFPAASNCLR